MQATAETAMDGGFRRNSVSELKLKNRCTGSTKPWKTIVADFFNIVIRTLGNKVGVTNCYYM